MGRWTANSDYDYAEAYGDPVPRQDENGPELRDHRPCDVCPHTAWLVNVDPDGFGHYQCNQGHLVIVAQPKQGAA